MQNVFSLYENRDPLDNSSKIGRGVGSFLSILGKTYDDYQAQKKADQSEASKRERVNAIIQEFNNPNSTEYEGMGQAQRYMKAARLLYQAGETDMSARFEAEANKIRQEEGKFGSAKEIAQLKAQTELDKQKAGLTAKSDLEKSKQIEELKKELTSDQWKTGQAVSGDNAKYTTWWNEVTGGGNYKTWLPTPNENAETRKAFFQTGGKGDIVSGATIGNQIAQSAYDTNVGKAGSMKADYDIGSSKKETYDANGQKFEVFSGVPTFMQSQVNKMSDDFAKNTATNKAEVSAANKLVATLGTGDLKGVRAIAAVFMQMKALDPTSTVREGEFDSMAGANGAYGRFTNLINQLNSGVTLSADQVEDMKTLAGVYKTIAENKIKDVQSAYSNLALEYGIKPSYVVGAGAISPSPSGNDVKF